MTQIYRSEQTYTTKGQKIYSREAVSTGSMYAPQIQDLPDYSAINEAIAEDMRKGFIHRFYIGKEVVADILYLDGADFKMLPQLPDKMREEYTALLSINFCFLKEFIERCERATKHKQSA